MSFIFCNPQIKEDETGGAYDTYGEVKNAYRGFVGKPVRNRSITKSKLIRGKKILQWTLNK